MRYYLAREIVFGQDGSFSPEQFVERCNADLANSLGNLLNRTVSMIIKYFDGVIPEYKGKVTPFDGEIESFTETVIKSYEDLMDDLKITDALAMVNELSNRANKYIDETTPWALAKDEAKKDELASVMYHLAMSIFVCGMLFKPVLVKSIDRIFDQLGIEEANRAYDKIHDYGCLSGLKVNKGEQLFPRLDAAVEVQFIKDLMGENK